MLWIDSVSRRTRGSIAAAALCAFFVLPGIAAAQPKHDRTERTVFGHLHVHPTSVAEHNTFWLETLGGVLGHVGKMAVAKFPDGLVEWESPTWADLAPAGGTKGRTVDHVAFSVPNLRAMLTRVTAAGYPVVTRDELPGVKETNGIAVHPEEKTTVAFVLGPDKMLLELVELKAQKVPIAMHHIHFAAAQVPEVEAWYRMLTGAKPGKRGSVVDARFTGTNLTFSPAAKPVVGTKGSVLDHIGFEVKDLPAMVKELQGMGVKFGTISVRKSPTGISIAYLTDPWGTYIELSEGLDLVE